MVIRMRHTRSHTKNRRSHHALKAPALSACSNCGAQHRPHHMCQECGFYNGRQVMDMGSLKEKREARMKAKRDRIKLEAAQAAPEATETSEEVETKEPVGAIKESEKKNNRSEKKEE